MTPRIWTPDRSLVIPHGFRREDYERSRLRLPPFTRRREPLQLANPIVVQNGSANSATGGPTDALAYGSNVVSGNTLIAVCAIDSVTATLTGGATGSVKDTQVNTWNIDFGPFDVNAGGLLKRVYCFSTTAGASGANTVTLTGGVGIVQEMFLFEISGLNGADSISAHATGSTANPASGAGTPNQSVGAAIGFMSTAGSTVPTAGSGWSGLNNNKDADNDSVESLVYTTNAALNAQFTDADTNEWLACLFVYLQTGGFTAVNRRSTGPRVGSRSYY